MTIDHDICRDHNLITHSSDPLLFPGKASEELLKKFPPTVIYEVKKKLLYFLIQMLTLLLVMSSNDGKIIMIPFVQ